MRIDEVTTPYEPVKNDIGLMTSKEFLDFRNPDGKIHPENSYDMDLKKLNQDYSLQHVFTNNGRDSKYFDWIGQNSKGYIFFKGYDHDIVAFVVGDTLYRTAKFPKNILPFGFTDRQGQEHRIAPTKEKLIKYVSDYIQLVDDKLGRNKENYPFVMKRFKSNGEDFEVRSEKSPYEENSGTTFVIMNSSGFVVAQASDEWGTTLLVVAKEYRGFGLGQTIGKIWYKLNPEYGSGGFTPQGMKNALKIWEERVRDFLSNGWYSEMVRDGSITRERVREIISGLPERKVRKNKPEKQPLVYVTDSSFIVYDKAFFEDRLEEYIYAFGFFREHDEKSFLYTIDYEKGFKRLASYLALQIARDNGEKIFIGDLPSDVVEFDDLEDVTIDGDYASLDKDVLPLKALGAYEKTYRKAHDQYDEAYYDLQEIANGKWA